MYTENNITLDVVLFYYITALRAGNIGNLFSQNIVLNDPYLKDWPSHFC